MRGAENTNICKKLLKVSSPIQHQFNDPGQDCGLKLRAKNASEGEKVPKKASRDKPGEKSWLSAVNIPKAGHSYSESQ